MNIKDNNSEKILYSIFHPIQIFRRHYFTKYARAYRCLQVATPMEKYTAYIQ